ncbi:MAG TPA: DUF1595 domain-containing protein [Cellvibrio sp.]|nr:DUF1595 domain-containing protein [Cellvibrio sp.]
MPSHDKGTCTGTCAQTLGLYIYNNLGATSTAEPLKLLKQTAPTSSEFSLLASSDTSCSVAYSENDLRPLSKQEYASTLLRLTGINLIGNSDTSIYDALPPDNLISTFYNNETIVIDSDIKRAYQNAASKIVAQLYSQNFNGIVDCSNNNNEECYNKLIDDFACKVFRRPLTAEERAAYRPLFVSDKKDGIKNIINVLLSSPEFIYRSDIGLTLVNPAAETALVNGAPLINNVKTIRIYEKENLNANLAGNDVLEISVKATQSPSGLWPVMRVQVGQTTFVDLVVKHTDTQIYRLQVTGLTGNNSVSIINQQTGAALEYQTGHNLVVSSVKLLSSD